MTTIDATSSTFPEVVLEQSKKHPVIVDFWAPWCGPCRSLGPTLERLAQEADGAWSLVKINTDEHQELAATFRIQGIPAVKAFVNGDVVDEFTGALPEPQIRAWLDGFLPKPAEEAAARALEFFSNGAINEGRIELEDAEALDPSNPLVLVAQAHLSIANGEIQQAQEIIEKLRGEPKVESLVAAIRVQLQGAAVGDIDAIRTKIDENPNDFASHMDLGHALMAQNQIEEAFGSWLLVVSKSEDPLRDNARQAMVDAFNALGRNEVTDTWRSKLAMELYK